MGRAVARCGLAAIPWLFPKVPTVPLRSFPLWPNRRRPSALAAKTFRQVHRAVGLRLRLRLGSVCQSADHDGRDFRPALSDRPLFRDRGRGAVLQKVADREAAGPVPLQVRTLPHRRRDWARYYPPRLRRDRLGAESASRSRPHHHALLRAPLARAADRPVRRPRRGLRGPRLAAVRGRLLSGAAVGAAARAQHGPASDRDSAAAHDERRALHQRQRDASCEPRAAVRRGRPVGHGRVRQPIGAHACEACTVGISEGVCSAPLHTPLHELLEQVAPLEQVPWAPQLHDLLARQGGAREKPGTGRVVCAQAVAQRTVPSVRLDQGR